ncbi:carbon storage regulator [Rubinisphaera margarita]|uniref:carbon storage regulator n=1 Tax=Rubinisphaera margarita TaxID=2909586 RepID=UPI0036F41E6F
MLVLTTKPGDSIMISDDIRLTLTRTAGNRIEIGIEAPRRIGVERMEVRSRNDAGLEILPVRSPG